MCVYNKKRIVRPITGGWREVKKTVQCLGQTDRDNAILRFP